MAVITQKQFYDTMRDEIKGLSNLSDFNAGSFLDIITGATSIAMNEISVQIISEFLKTYLSTAEGDDLEYLATDHFGPSFARPDATKATAIVKFSRPDNSAGDVVIGIGTTLKTPKDFAGNEILFTVTQQVTMTGTEINAPVTANDAGLNGNVAANAISVIETTLTDSSVVVTNESPAAGGAEKLDDSEYYEFIIDKIQFSIKALYFFFNADKK